VVRAATTAYLECRALDMSALAADVNLSRATLYRRIGNYDGLVGRVLADQTEQTFRLCVETASGDGIERVRNVVKRFVDLVHRAEPLRVFITRDPLLFVRVTLAPGHVETRATTLFTELLANSGVEFSVPITALALAIVRSGGSLTFTHLLGDPESATDNVIALVDLLLNSAASPVAATNRRRPAG
jgi:AcrR family transcriptional regulator